MTQPLTIYPMKCRGPQPQGKIIAEEKFDGHRALLHIGHSLARAYLTSGNTSKVTGLPGENGLCVPHIITVSQEFAEDSGLGYTILDGEITVPGYPFEAVQSVLGSDRQAALEWQGDNARAVFNAFDILYYNGEDVRHLSWRERQKLLSNVVYGICEEECVRRVTSSEGTGREYFRPLFDKIVASGGEGLILKDPEAAYGVGWVKWKKEETYDVVVMGVVPGAGKYCELPGAVIFGAYRDGVLVEMGRCSGMSDGFVSWVNEEGSTAKPNSPGARLRICPNFCVAGINCRPHQEPGTRAWFDDPAVIGKVIEVKCNGLTKYKNLRHPQFVRVRDDKPAEQCLAP